MRIVLYGATGYTGKLTAAALARRDAKVVLAGRDRRRLTELADELGVPSEVAVADAADERSVRDLVEPGDVLVTTVGPFSRVGLPAARAVAAAGATYLDSTGEPAFIRRLADELDGEARRTGATLVPAFGYDYVPGNLAAEMVLRQAPDATRLRVGYFVKGRGGTSGGTAASGAGMLIDPAYAWRGGRLVSDRMASRVADFEIGERTLRAVSIAGSEHLWMPRRYPALTDVDVYLGWAGRAARAAQAVSHTLRAVTLLPGASGLAHAVARRALPGSTGGPDEQARAGARTLVVADAVVPGRGRLARVVLDGPSPYDLTADLLAWAALRASERRPEAPGVVGPADVFGYDELVAGCDAIGLRPVDADG